MSGYDHRERPRRVGWLSDMRVWLLVVPLLLWLGYILGVFTPSPASLCWLGVGTVLAGAVAVAAARDVWLVNARGIEVEAEVVAWYGGSCPRVSFTWAGIEFRQRVTQYVRRRLEVGARVILAVDPNRPSRCYIVERS
jgi:hypothetical protein